MADLRLFANTSNLIRFVLKHATTGQGLTGLTSASAGLIISTVADNEATATTYTQAGSTIETITTLGTFATPTATKCRFKEVDATNHKGLYEFQFADARFAVASSRRLVISVTGATNLLDTDYEIQLVQFNPYDAVRLGLTALPNAAAEAAGGLFTRGTGAGQINQAANGMIDTNPVRLNNVSQSLLDLKDFADDGYDPSTNKVQGVVLTDTVTTYTGNTPQTGDSFARLGLPAGASVSADVAALSVLVTAVKAKTDQLVFTLTNKVDASIQAAGDFAQAAADKVWSTTSRTLSAFGFSVTVGTNNDKTGYSLSAAGVQAIWDALTSALTTVGSIGKLLVDNVNATISTRSSHSAADVWAVATRILTAGTNIVLAKGTGVTGFNDLSAADVRTAVGLGSANLDTQLTPLAKLDTAMEIDGAVYRFTANALEQAPAGGGGTGLINFVYGGEWLLDQQNRITFYLQSSAGAAVTGLGSGFTLTLSKNTAAFAASAGTKAEVGNGWYTYLTTAGEADTIGTVAVKVTGTGAIEQKLEYVVGQRNSGAIAYTYTVTRSDNANPIEGVAVWFATNSSFANIVFTGTTDTFGVLRDSNGNLPLLDSGTYHIRLQKTGITFSDDTEVVS